MITEDILMHCVKRGGDRQVLHERLRQHSLEAAKKVKQEGANNDLINRILSDAAFGLTESEINLLLDASQFTGRAKEQTEEFLSEVVMQVLNENRELLGVDIRIMV